MKRASESLHVVVYLLLGGLVLFVWPAGAIASAMGIAGHFSEETPILMVLTAMFFHLGVLCYPIFYIFCLLAAIFKMSDRSEPKNYPPSFWAGLPLVYIALIFAIFFLGQLERIKN